MIAQQPEMNLFEDKVPEVFMEQAYSELLWKVLESQYDDLGFDVLTDETFKQLVLTSII